MRSETDSSIARKYIKENKDKMDRSVIVNHLFKVTNLSRATIHNIFAQILDIRNHGEEKLCGKDGQNAKKFILDNMDKMSEEEIIEHISKNTILNELSAEAIYYVVKNREVFEKQKKITEEKLNKVRKRNVITIDDSKLYRKVQG